MTLTYDIKVVEIPRLNINGVAVSASRVRELLAEDRLWELEKLVPAPTYQFLRSLKEQG